MTAYLKQSTAVEVGIGPFVDSVDGVTAETALTITQPDIRLKKNAGAWVQKNAAQTLTHEENGWYEIALDSTDTNTLGILIVAIAEAGALPVWREFTVLAANIYDSMILASDLFDVSMTQILGTAVSTPATAGILDINLKNIANAVVNTATVQIGANAVQAGGTAWNSGAIAAATFSADAITAAKVAADVSTEITAAVWAAAVRTLTANTNLNDLSAAGMRAALGMAAADLDTQLGALPTNAELATSQAAADDATLAAVALVPGLVWDEALAGHLVAGSTGAELDLAGASGDPWTIALPGAYGAGTAGNIVGNFIDAAISSRLATASYTSPLSSAGTRGALGMASANLDTQLGDIPTNAEHAAAMAAADDAVLAALTALNNLSAAQVYNEVVFAIATDVYAEPGIGTPAASTTLAAKINYIYKALRNKKTTDGTTFKLFNDDAVTVDQKATLADDGTTFTHGELVTGP